MFDEARFRQVMSEVVEAAIEKALAGKRPEYLSVADAAQMASVTPPTIRAWVAEGRLQRCQAGRELRVKRADLEALLAGRKDDVPDPEEEAMKLFRKAR